MTDYPHQALPMFAEPYCRAGIAGVISAEQIAYLKSLPLIDRGGNYFSENFYILEDPKLRSIKGAIDEALAIYARDVLAIPQTFYITQSWTQVQNPNLGMPGLSFANSIVSGVLYYDAPTSPPPSIVFSRFDTYQQIELKPDADRRNAFNVRTSRIQPNTNEVVLFASRLTHLVDPNLTGQQRFSIAFNTFVKGKLGDYHNATELTL